MADELFRVLTSTGDPAAARDLARAAVAAGLAGNAQVSGPLFAVFRHDGEVGEGEEYQLALSTTAAAYPELEAYLLAHHPWRNPEIVALPLARTTPQYAAWLRAATTARQG